MNRFRKLGYIEYNGRIRINRTLLNIVLLDALPKKTRPDLSSRSQFKQSTSFKVRVILLIHPFSSL